MAKKDDVKDEVEPEVKGKKSDFVTPRVDQGKEPIGAEDGVREPIVEGTSTTEVDASDEPADQSSLGGTETFRF